MLMLLSLTLLQQAQELRVMSNGMWGGEARGSMLAIQLTIDAAPNEAHDVLGQGACIATSISANVVVRELCWNSVGNRGPEVGAGSA